MKTTRTLHDGWSVRAGSGPAPEPIASAVIPATVPGVVHLDLMAAGLIPDPYLDDNESALAWIGLVDWTYETTFTVDASELAAHARHDLVFDGLDTVATVRLNGTTIAETANQHRTLPHRRARHPRRGRQRARRSSFRSPIRYANEQSVALGVRQRPYPLPYDAIRKSACSFGWDWGIKTATSGIWRPVRLESWSTARLATVRPQARVTDAAAGVVDVALAIERADAEPVTATVAVAGVSVSAELAAGETEATVSVVRPRCRAVVARRLRRAAAVRRGRAGRRHPESSSTSRAAASGSAPSRWDTTPDDAGTPFVLHVNGVPVFVKGANWIPDDALPGARRPRPLRAAAASGARRPPQPDPRLGRRHLRGRRLLRRRRRARPADLAGLPVRVRRVRRGGAAAQRGRGGGARQRHAHRPPRVARAAHRQQREPLGLRGLGLEAPPRRQDLGRATTTTTCSPRVVAELAPLVPYAPGSPFSPGERRTAPERPSSTARCTSGICGTSRTGRTTATTPRGSSPSSAGRVRRPGRP